ncbi:tRNA (5-methylaminomethyl-2-thiouridine)(34)-methyltransferase MnmD [Brevundimonas sp. 2R-24]|uniref:tRNA 5-methylaminomethyl-2-thiouridine biosynthesis bifunctional protein MnmC n=1 Tax=Peiella sedimenti TaxID=3061083 RepID=A0ABT8SHM5_9CAUL|nr:tRNA (5-methylaminomethyl-2-thiouridine)(34)-methyltransferase MnmD [Caulobacteraceae bacterium XZ-24]
MPDTHLIPAQLDWAETGPRSRLYGDVYFSAEDGLAETRAVFLAGCGLPEAWRGRARYTVAELGFGTGLNIAALLDLWRREGPSEGRLHIFSVEAHPLGREDAARALSAWPELAPVTDLLLARWPRQAAGLQRIDLPELPATLDLAVADAAEALAGWSGQADAWFLDGFAPSTNPAMWSDAVLDGIAARSAPGARVATFTVAGQVRRGLAARGFAVEKRPGWGRKRERLEARLPGAAADPHRGPVAVIGAGIAGAAVCRALRAEGVETVLIDGGEADMASANPAALVTPRLDAGGGAVAALHAQALLRAADLYDATPDAVTERGVLRLISSPDERRRFETVAAQPPWPAGALQLLSPSEASERLGASAPHGGLWIETARVVDPAAVRAAWTQGAQRLSARVASIEDGEGVRLLDADGALIVEADAAILCGGWSGQALTGLAMRPLRGQVSWAEGVDPPPVAAAWGGYAAPTPGGLLFGATHDRGDEALDLREGDHVRNLTALAQALPDIAEALTVPHLRGRAGVRATTADHNPVCGLLPGRGRTFVLTGLGGRGFAAAPLLAEHLVASLTGTPSPLPLHLIRLTDATRRAVAHAQA